MSYAHCSALGELSVWSWMGLSHTLDSNEVYVLRLQVAGVPLREPADLLVFARAAGQDQELLLDVRAVGAWKQPGMTDDQWAIDVVMTFAENHVVVPLFTDDGAQMGKRIGADPDFVLAFPKGQVVNGAFGELTAPADALDAWRSQPLLWDHSLPGARSHGGPTTTFASPVDLSLFKGKADDGRRAVTWNVTKPGLVAQNTPSGNSTALVVGAAIALGLGFVFWSRTARRRR